MTIESVANAVKELAGLFNCSYEDVWRRYMHPAITDGFTFEEVFPHINGEGV
ncbi:hypothetical protein JNUCC32_31280 (plasmid) [Paenibacillus sp. JNUCC32]|uniref:hypothetical protein n=1 Tax=Paenibacillus sp. JNUCC32 TaxID=2777984 RepID=UPI00178796BB|nr:hypothetical protein [Paenibacillus sp. JNUCC-32]QOT13683.1 hypothetical protein JNUCC32_31280 [Paenibacillus sp. JNUCC-32]